MEWTCPSPNPAMPHQIALMLLLPLGPAGLFLVPSPAPTQQDREIEAWSRRLDEQFQEKLRLMRSIEHGERQPPPPPAPLRYIET
jgi:hypothetical protein